MKICRYQIKDSPTTIPRLGIVSEEGEILDPSCSLCNRA